MPALLGREGLTVGRHHGPPGADDVLPEAVGGVQEISGSGNLAGDVIEIRQVQELSDFPPEIQSVAR